jgi:hypothetical protein
MLILRKFFLGILQSQANPLANKAIVSRGTNSRFMIEMGHNMDEG